MSLIHTLENLTRLSRNMTKIIDKYLKYTIQELYLEGPCKAHCIIGHSDRLHALYGIPPPKITYRLVWN